jgi:hypothetical protein
MLGIEQEQGYCFFIINKLSMGVAQRRFDHEAKLTNGVSES